MRNGLFLGALVMLLAFPLQGQASDADTIAALKAQVEMLAARLEQLEQSQADNQKIYEEAVETAAVTAAAPKQSSWIDTIKVKGDLRYRHEGFDVDNRRDRHRHRIRARAAVTAQVNDSVDVGFGLASGGSDPISTNQTLGNSSSSKGVVIDLAYVNWKTAVEGLAIRAGKFKNPFHRVGGNGLVWDGDLNPEGIAMTYANGNTFASLMGSWVTESSSDDDSFLLGGQFGFRGDVGESSDLVAGVGYYNYLDSRGEPAFLGGGRGNQLNPDGTYLDGFEIVEGFIEYGFPVGDSDLTLFADYVQNLDADDFDTGYAVGAKLKSNAWQFGWAWQELEPNAVLATFTDSDFIGGGTDGKGHILQTSYALSKRISVKGTLFLNERFVDIGEEEDYKRLQLDISFKY